MRADVITQGSSLIVLFLLGWWPHAEASELRWTEPRRLATGGGLQGPWRMNESAYDYVDDPAVALGTDGSAAVVWVDQARKDVYLQRYRADGARHFRQPVNVSRSSDVFSWLPRIALGPSQPPEVHVLWQEIIFSGGSHGGDILFARSTDGGRSFSEPLNLSDDTAGSGKGRLTEDNWHNGSLDLAVSSDGTLHAVWTDYEGSLWSSRSTDAGRSFSEPLQLVTPGEAAPARGPALGSGDADTIHVAWSVGERRGGDVHLVRSVDGGQSFSEPRIAHRTDGHADAPTIAVDGGGALHLVHGESSDGPFSPYRVVYSRLDAWDGAFTAPIELSRAEAAGLRSAGFPSLAIGRDDHLFVIWETFPDGASRPRGLGYSHSRNGGRSWSAPARVAADLEPEGAINGSLQGLLMDKLDANDAGDIAVVNSTFRRNEASYVWLVRGRAEAAPR